jgi:uncharacterized repeat protein (TIGR03833 family)
MADQKPELSADDNHRGTCRDAIRIGLTVDIIQKKDQHSGKLTRGRVQEILTGSVTHPHGIKVRLEGGHVGRVAVIVGINENGSNEISYR